MPRVPVLALASAVLLACLPACQSEQKGPPSTGQVTPTVAGGNITLHRASDDSVVETFDVNTPGDISIVGATVTITPTNLLVGNTEYYLLIDANSFEDAAGNPYGGLSDKTVWSFTVDSIAPVLASLSPADD